jgi:hypothetical protein
MCNWRCGVQHQNSKCGVTAMLFASVLFKSEKYLLPILLGSIFLNFSYLPLEQFGTTFIKVLFIINAGIAKLHFVSSKAK